MYKIFIVMALALVACGDTPKKSSSKLPSNNASGNNTTNNDTSGSPNVIVNPNNFTNNTSNNATNNVVNNSTNNVNNSTNNNPNNVVDPVTQKCTGYCELIMGTCVTDNCSLTGSVETARQANLAKCMGTDADSCTSRYRSDLSFRDAVDNAPVGNCFDMDVEIGRCVGFGFEACNCPLPELDTTCTADNQCNAGYLNGSCITSAMGGPEGGVCLEWDASWARMRPSGPRVKVMQTAVAQRTCVTRLMPPRTTASRAAPAVLSAVLISPAGSNSNFLTGLTGTVRRRQ